MNVEEMLDTVMKYAGMYAYLTDVLFMLYR